MADTKLRVLAEGLRFPEGPVYMKDGSVAFVEIERGTVRRWTPDGKVAIVSQHTGGPNGLAVGPDGAFYVCNNGGFGWTESDGLLFEAGEPEHNTGGRIERVDSKTGAVTTLYDSCDGRPLRGPNDLVFDRHGGFYFTDMGKARTYDLDKGGLYYAKADGSKIVEIAYPVPRPNGCGISPDGKLFYFVELETSRLWAFDIVAPGVVKKVGFPLSAHGGRLVCGLPGFQFLDGIALDEDGNVYMCCVLGVDPRIVVVSPKGEVLREVSMPEPFPTNLCFGGPNRSTLFVTLSGTGKLVTFEWDRKGALLSYEF